MRISDGSSDVCSSDLDADIGKIGKILEQLDRKARQDQRADQKGEEAEALLQGPGVHAAARRRIEDKQAEAGDRTDRKRAEEGKSVSVRVDSGGRRLIKKKIKRSDSQHTQNQAT